jgi:5-formyltetrahydrofolate cyclo-ligase
LAETLSGSKNNLKPNIVLRPEYIATRKQISSLARQTASGIITRKIIAHPKINAASIISVFISTTYEVGTRDLIQQLLIQGKTLFAPAITSDTIVLRQLTSLEACIPGQKNILQPPLNAPLIDPAEIDVFIVPGLSFDAFKYRLGYGKAYYDRLLKNTPGYKIGIAFTDQLCYHLPHDSHDIKMDQVISDTITLTRSILTKTSYH